MFLRYLTVVCLLAIAITETTTLVPSSTISSTIHVDTGPPASTTPAPPTAATEISTTPAPVNPTIPVAPTLPPIIGCPANLCPLQSECLDGVCLCISGTFLQDGQCIAAQVFPLSLRVISTFQHGMEDRSSEIFRETAQNISDALFEVLYGTQGYVRSEVVKLEEGSVVATVNNIYENTDITEAEIMEKIENATESNELLSGATFNSIDLCEMEPFPCDKTSTTCSITKGRTSCPCKDGYVTSQFSINSCIACPSGQRAVNDECKPCSFGYAGFNCDDSTVLVMVVVSCVLGGILLIMVLTLLIYCFGKGPLKNLSGRPDYAENSISSENGNKPTSFPRFPHADDNYTIELTEGDHTYGMIDEVQRTNG